MDFNNLIQGSMLGLGIFVLVMHAIIGALLTLVVEYFGGCEGSIKFAKRWFLPHWIISIVLTKILWVLKAPWRYRSHRLFKEAFGFEPDSEISESKVYDNLRSIARIYNQACVSEINLKNKVPPDLEEVKNAAASVAYWKSRFWKTHDLAKRYGYQVYARYGDYLK